MISPTVTSKSLYNYIQTTIFQSKRHLSFHHSQISVRLFGPENHVPKVTSHPDSTPHWPLGADEPRARGGDTENHTTVKTLIILFYQSFSIHLLTYGASGVYVQVYYVSIQVKTVAFRIANMHSDTGFSFIPSFLRGLSLLPLAWMKQPNPQRQWGTESSSSTEQQQPQAEATTLLHESPDSKPETIEQRKIVFHHIRVWVAGMRVVPLVRAKPREGESREKYVSA